MHIDADPMKVGTEPDKYIWRFLNHSCNPNCYFNPEKLELIALTDIEPNTELSINYLCTEYEMATPFTCNCGEPSCLKQIWGYKFLSKLEKKTLSINVANHIDFLEDMNKFTEVMN